MLHWNCKNVQTHEGRAYAHDAYPHIGAPGGPCDAFDLWQYLTIWLQWASRLGKTFFGECATLKTADSDPCPMMFASADAKLAKEVVGRTYGMIERCPRLREQLPKRRRQDLVKLWFCRIFVAWSRSASTLADKAVRVGHANEIDKWEHPSTSREADPLKLFDDRFKEFPAHKKIKEGTPQLKHSSRVERGRLASTNCQYNVPCPHCDRYQTLRMGDGKSRGGIVWEKNEAGKSDKELARKTARYLCLHCGEAIRDEHRGPMMRAGVWCPEGCQVNDAEAKKVAAEWPTRQDFWGGWQSSPWVTESPLRDGRDAGYQLSSLYALSLGWGDIAAEFVDSKANQQNLRNFINQWLAETWEIVSRKETWEQVGQRIINAEYRRGVVPKWASLLTIGVDYQHGKGIYPWVVDAWGPGRRNATIAYGEADSLDELEQGVIRTAWTHADGGPSLKIHTGLIDSGNRPLGIYEFCERFNRSGIQLFPCKGSNRALASDYDRVVLGQNTAKPGTVLYHVDTVRSQIWMERTIHDIPRDGDGGFSLHAGNLFEHQDFLQQLLNDAPVEKLDAHNNASESWDRIDTNVPNDLRDCKRYAYAAMLIASRNGRIYPRDYTAPKPVEQVPSRVRELRIRR
jgi:phage terminase large subunit GpA-like protein